ncbi:MAG: DUF2975 domain-containing protein [Verrucomicrobiota bacterium]
MNTNEITAIVMLCLCLAAFRIWRKTKNNDAKPPDNQLKQISHKASSRMNRIQKASKGIRLALQYGFPVLVMMLMLIIVLLPTYGITAPREYLMNSLHAMTPAGKTMAQPPFNSFLSIINLVIFGLSFRTILKLLGFFEKGILFAKETVHCIKILGCLAIASGVIELIFSIAIQNYGVRTLGAGLGNLFEGFFIFFIAWIMDEGRKIQEEQELTV